MLDKYDDYLYSLAEQVYEDSVEVEEEYDDRPVFYLGWGTDPDWEELPF